MLADGAVTSTSYSGSCTTETDWAGHARGDICGWVGGLTAVWEDPGGYNYETTYDALYDSQNAGAPRCVTCFSPRPFAQLAARYT